VNSEFGIRNSPTAANSGRGRGGRRPGVSRVGGGGREGLRPLADGGESRRPKGVSNSELAPDAPRETEGRRPCTVGLTGGLATGKSTVARILSVRGIPVFDADAAVHDLYEPGRAGAAAVAELFGAAVLDAEGGVVRATLSEMVLGNPSARLRLESAIHPLVREAVVEWLESVGDRPVAVVEAALLTETGSYREYDILMVVWCDHNQQLQRAVARGVPEERARGLINAQLPIAEKKELADVLVDNRGALEDLSLEIDRAWSQVQRLCAERPSHRDEDRLNLGGASPR
jgi:dephospho-CoA kinase